MFSAMREKRRCRTEMAKAATYDEWRAAARRLDLIEENHRWMHEDDATFVKTIKKATGNDHDKSWARQGQAWDAFVNEMWGKHRPTLDAPADGWKQKHDDRYYRTAIEKSQ